MSDPGDDLGGIHSGHDGGSAAASAGGHHGMVPYLHFQGGDMLFFESWAPKSPGALAGACIGLIFLALFERWVAATRSVFDEHWRRRAQVITAPRDRVVLAETLLRGKAQTTEGVQEVERGSSTTLPLRTRLRTIPPFIAAHDIPRGILYAFQMFLGYALMLAVMTYQAAFIISILIGLGIGEMLFGRVIRGHGDHH